ncbi:synaptic vesicle membrane protein VAT-1 homolog-like isoform X2 [Liolophura sinensis]|uniref:synaptic vesicle membrane protein VAT-1 homolog-like isoform X2 n=1 Tax=Liolophura sinensis TaxID=3198878 RepID=UPI003158F32B
MPETTAAADMPESQLAPVQENVEVAKKEMRAVLLTGFGGVKMLKTQSIPEVAPSEGEVAVRVKACGLNFLDLMVRQGVIDNPPKTPITMGFECSGEVEAVGENTPGVAVGDRVIVLTDYKAWSEVVVVNANFVYKMPDSLSFQDGAALAMNYLTAYIMLFDIGNLCKGKSVLLHSAGGGVGHAVCQLCRTQEEVTVFGTASYHKHEAIKTMVTHLFDHVVDYGQEVRKLSPEGVDIVLDCLCGEDANKGIALLKPLGKYILYGSSNIVTGETKSFFSFAKSWWQVDKISPIKLYDDNKSVAGFQLRQLLFRQGGATYVRNVMDRLFTMYKQGQIRPIVDSVWAFEDVGDAMTKLHDRKNIGKVLLDPSLQPKTKTSADAAPAAEDTEKKECQNGDQ